MSKSDRRHYGKWFILRPMPSKLMDNGQWMEQVEAQCQCGTKRVVTLNHISSGEQPDCGCVYRAEKAAGLR